MTQIFAARTAALDPDSAVLRARLSAARLAYIDRLRGTARAQSFAASLLLDHAMQRCFPAVPRPLALSVQEGGKPYLTDAPHARFSLSHSDVWAVCAVSGHPVGVDIQRRETGRRDIAARFFHPDEVQYLHSLSPAARERAFYTLWALKESYVKADGRGLRLLRHFCIDISSDMPRVTVGTPCSLFLPAFPDPDYQLALCVMTDREAVPEIQICTDFT